MHLYKLVFCHFTGPALESKSVLACAKLWSGKEALRLFQVRHQPARGGAKQTIDVRNREDYPFSNIFFFVEMEFPNGKKSVDTVECMLADEQGAWLGEPTASLYDHEFLYQRAKQFPLGGRYKIDIRHGMRVDELKGVTDIGFKLTHTKP